MPAPDNHDESQDLNKQQTEHLKKKKVKVQVLGDESPTSSFEI